MLIGFLGLGLSFVLGLMFYPTFIEYLQKNDVSQKTSEYALEEYKNKKPTVTFGGVLFVVIPIIVSLLLSLFKPSPTTLLIILVFLAYGLIGLVDDYLIIKKANNDGLSALHKFLMQVVLGVVFYFAYIQLGGNTLINFPFVEKPIEIGYFYPILVVFMLSGASNAVNLTDGMDGLASGTMIIALVPFAYFAFQGNDKSLFLLILSLIGALIAFLFFNRKPAKIFMGDVGSLPLGAFLAMVAIILNKEIILAIIGGVFVYETLTVVIQRISYKVRGKRVFKYTPIHYSYTISGWEEKDVVLFFYGLGLTFMIIGLGLSALS